MQRLHCVTVLCLTVILNGIFIDGFIIISADDADGDSNEYFLIKRIVAAESLNDYLTDSQVESRTGRFKRSPDADQKNQYYSYPPEYRKGYYVFPADYDRNLLRREQSNLQYNPVLSYRTVKTKKKKLFVPNLFG